MIHEGVEYLGHQNWILRKTSPRGSYSQVWNLETSSERSDVDVILFLNMQQSLIREQFVCAIELRILNGCNICGKLVALILP